MTANTSNKKGLSFYIILIAGVIGLIAVDRFTKWLAVEYLMDKPDCILADGVLRLHYLENRGAAFGMLQNSQILFSILTFVFLAVIIWYFVKVPADKRYRPFNVCLTFLAAGALGNFIDRLSQQYVVDFIYFEIIDFPVFNVADIYVSISVIVIVLLLIFHYKDGEFKFMLKGRKTKNE